MPYAEERARVEEVIDAVVEDLSGRAPVHSNILDLEPKSRLCIGVLTAPPADLSEEARARRVRRSPESIGFEARVAADAQTIAGTADVKLTLYYRVIPTLDEQLYFSTGRGKQNVRPKYRRAETSLSGLAFSVAVPDAGSTSVGSTDTANATIATAFSDLAARVKSDQEFWPSSRDEKIAAADLTDHAAFRRALSGFVPETIPWHGTLRVELRSTSGALRLAVLFSNSSGASEVHPTQFFDVHVNVNLTSGRFTPSDFAAAALDYRYATKTWGRGVNAVLEVSEDERSAFANTVPIFQQQRLASRDVGEIAEPKLLMSDRVFEALSAIEAELRSYARRWEQFIECASDPAVRDSSQRDLNEYREEISTFQLGVEALRTDERLLRAFRFMNETAHDHEIERWRFFQIVFIVSMLPSLIARENSDPRWQNELQVADILWFPTAAGKTEAYFGIIVTAMFYDRLRGKKAGTTAWLRYPLRMLSIQQLQRLVEFVTTAEGVRARHCAAKGDDEFTVGYYVGSANTPNFLTKKNGPHPIVALKARMTAGGANAGSLRVLQRCPSCESPNVEIDIRDDIRELRILHTCRNCGKTAPINISDAEIYRYLPTILVGTVDRLARAGETQHFAHIFGQVDSVCPQHGYASFRECVEGGCNLTKSRFTAATAIKDPTPALLLQDELHLLKESLGTYDSHYEGYLDEESRRVGTNLPSKRLAATATIEGYERHVQELYGRRPRRFPSKGIAIDDTPYMCADSNNPYARIYCGILPLGLTTDQVCARIALTVDSLAADHWTKAPSDSDNNQYDLSLLYVNVKDAAGNIGASLKNQISVRTLSGERSLDEVREAIDVITSDERHPYANRLKCVIATSIISHGVDLERLNIMAFSGFPGRAADYIQSSSRVGRQHVGVVFTVFNPVDNIDRSTYVHFNEYHDRLYQLVQPVPISKFAEAAVIRTFTGIYSATLLNILSREKRTNFIRGNSAVAALLNGTLTDEEIRDSILDSYGISGLEAALSAKYGDVIARQSARARMDLEAGEEWATPKRLKPIPVSSLRQVHEQIEFRIDMTRIRAIDALRRRRP